MWSLWWVWMIGAVALAILEVIAPAYLFLGFSIGAALVGLLLLIGVGFSGSLPVTLLVFAVLSLVSWLVLRRVLGVRDGQVKIWHKDINEND